MTNLGVYSPGNTDEGLSAFDIVFVVFQRKVRVETIIVR